MRYIADLDPDLWPTLELADADTRLQAAELLGELADEEFARHLAWIDTLAALECQSSTGREP